MPKILLRMEGLTVFTVSLYFYSYLDYSWLVFIILLFAPDLAALGYIKNVHVGSIIYNLFHTYTMPTAMMFISLFFKSDVIFMLSLIWIAHIGMDRIFGYGLKYPTTFQDTHLNQV